MWSQLHVMTAGNIFLLKHLLYFPSDLLVTVQSSCSSHWLSLRKNFCTCFYNINLKILLKTKFNNKLLLIPIIQYSNVLGVIWTECSESIQVKLLATLSMDMFFVFIFISIVISLPLYLHCMLVEMHDC